MSTLPSTSSVYEQILAELLEQLAMDYDVPPALIAGLRRLANEGKMDDSARIQQVINASVRGDDEAA